MIDDRLWSAEDLSGFLGIPLKTIYNWRHKRTGPQAIKVGRHLRYRRADVEQWLDELALAY